MPQVAGLRGVLSSDPGSRDTSRAMYRYHQVFAGPGGRSLTRKMVLCALRLAPWKDGSVRPHAQADETVRAAELARMRTAHAHSGAVLAGYRDAPGEIERLFRKAEGTRPTLETTTPDGTTHRVWRVQDAEVIGKMRTVMAPKPVHVLDGHARYEAMLAYHEELAGKTSLAMYSSANYGLACLVELGDPALVVAARHRMLRVTGDAPKSEPILAAAKTLFIVDRIAGGATDANKALSALGDTVAHQPAFVIAFAGEPDAWKLTLKPDVNPAAEGVSVHRAVHKLEPFIIEHLFLDKAMKGATATSTSDASVALANKAHAVILTRPLSLMDILRVDEHEQRLPAHATALHPTLHDGLVQLPIDPDEDLV